MEVKVINYDDLGNGLSKSNGKVTFIQYAIPDELVDIKIIKENKHYNVAVINEVIKPSKKRITPVCKYYFECGGCNFLHVEKQEEREFKINRIKRFFGKLDNFYETNEFNYRNKIVLHVKNGEYGFYKEKSNDITVINYCYLASPKINDILKLLTSLVDKNFSGSVLIRVNSNLESLVAIIGNYKYVDNLINNNLIDNLVYNDKVLKGNDYFYEYINNYIFKVNYKSFFQVNIKGLLEIVNILDDYLKDKKINKALDLYSGTSVLGIILSKYVNKVWSIESNINATFDAKENIKLNSIANLEIINGLVENYIQDFKNIDLIIVDPARRGLDKKTIEYLNKIKSRYLIYIACGIDSLKRDMKLLNGNYEIDKFYGVDMFPRTNKVECIAILKLNG